MKNLLALFVLPMLVLLSCGNNQEEKAKENIKKYLTENLKEGNSISFSAFSRLYILSPQNIDMIPTSDAKEEKSEKLNDFVNLFSLYSPSLALAVDKCNPSILESIIENDKKFKQWNTGGKEFAMVFFFKVTDKFLNEAECGFCVRLDSTLNVSKFCELKEEVKIKKMITINK